MATVLVCDDEVLNRKIASSILLKEGYQVVQACNGLEALDALKKNSIDLILMDLMMPEMDGYEATKIIKNDPKTYTIPLIIISALSDRAAITKGLELGANEYISKPFDVVEFALRVKNSVKMGELQNQKSEKDIIFILGKTAEYRDNETSTHTVRVGEMSALMAEKFHWKQEQIELMLLAAPMHDIGKVGIEDAVLLKPAKLTDGEYTIMKKHAEIGYQILSQKQSPLLKLAAEIAYTHHEKFNGHGYPRGLSGEDIPLSGRIVAIVDVFDALLSKRPYKEAFSLEKTIAIIEADSGSHFCPEVSKVFLENLDQMLEIRQRLNDV